MYIPMSVCDVYMNSKIPRPEGKRETGGSPVRTRHRDKLMPRHYVTGETREDAVDGVCSKAAGLRFKPGNLPVLECIRPRVTGRTVRGLSPFILVRVTWGSDRSVAGFFYARSCMI